MDNRNSLEWTINENGVGGLRNMHVFHGNGKGRTFERIGGED